jgi:transposase
VLKAMKKRQFSAEYKTKIVLEIIQGDEQIGAIAARESISRNQLQNWKKEFIENASRAFSQNKDEKEAQKIISETKEREEKLMAKLGQLVIENDWLKKKSAQVLGPDWETKSGYKKL